MVRRRVASVILATGAVLVLSGPGAWASCAAPEPFAKAFDSAPAVFTGTVIGLDNGRRWATVDVDELWTGDAIPPEVEVRAGPQDPPGPTNVGSSVERHFRMGARYLFVPYRRNGSIFRDNNCTRTTVFRPALERLRPPGAEAMHPSRTPTPASDESPTSASDDPGDSGTPWAPIALGAVAVVAAGTLLFRATRSKS